MAMQMGALRDALIDAGAEPEKAARAAEEMAGYDSRLSSIDLRLERIGGELNLHRWMLASIFALLVAVALKLFIH